MRKWLVQVISYDNGLIKEIECHSYKQADKVESGLTRQINLDGYYTKIVWQKEAE